MIGFNDIPAALRLPGAFIEFDNSLANNAGVQHKVLYIGQRLATGTVAEAVPTRITTAEQGEALFGRGSQLAIMLKAGKSIDPFMETWAIALDDAGAGTTAEGNIVVTGSATANGAIALYVAGNKLSVAVTLGDTANDIATSIAAAITAQTDLPVTAAVALGVVTITARNKGECGNDIDLRAGYYGETLPDGVALSFTEMGDGVTNPDLNTVIAVLGAEWYNWIVCPYTDTANLIVLETELDSRWGPMRQIGARAFTAFRGNHAAVSNHGGARNNPHVTCIGTNTSPTQPEVWAASYAMVAAKSLSIDPARPLQTLKIPGLKAADLVNRWSDAERNLLLFDGISTYTVGNDGSIYIERAITMYQTNAAGIADDSYLNLNTPETLERIRYEQRAYFLSRYPRHKLAGDDARPAPGQPVMQPKLAKGELLGLYREMESRGWVQDYEGYKERLIVEIDVDNPDRMNWQDSPKLVSGLRTIAGLAQFRR